MSEPINQIIEALNTGRNLFITGGAGTGKSYNLRKVIEWAEEKDLNVARTAMTGMASLQFDFGETLHRCFGIGFNNHKSKLKNVVTSYTFINKTKDE